MKNKLLKTYDIIKVVISMLLKDVVPIQADSKSVYSEGDLTKLCEVSVLEACKIFLNLVVCTVMSSGNVDNVLTFQKARVVYTEKDIIPADTNDFSYGYGYAWIMLDYDSLNHLNKDLVLSLSSDESCEIVDCLSDEAKALFIQRCRIDNVKPADNQLVQLCLVPNRSCRMYFTHHRYHQKLTEELTKLKTNPNPLDNLSTAFYEKANMLFTTPYKERVVLLRYPVGEMTTVEEVSSFFVNLASKFSKNTLERISIKK